ncbi:MAG TPA: hypothetical protein VIO94_07375 [Phenylobacterium sp.]
MADMALFPIGARWVLLDERSTELGEFESKPQALAAADDYVRRGGEPRYLMIQDGDWRETLIEPPARRLS